MTTHVGPQTDTQIQEAKDGKSQSVRSTGPHAVQELIQFSAETAWRLADEAAQIETRGFKLLLKALGERHMRYARELAVLTQRSTADGPPPPQASDELELGFQTIQTSMTVQREGRQDILMNKLLDEEEALLEKYDKAIASRPPEPIGSVLAAQKDRLAQLRNNIRQVVDGSRQLVARVYDDQESGERAMTSLQAQGIDESSMDMLEGEQIRSRIGKVPTPPKIMPTAVTGAIGGGVVGLLIGVAWWLLLAAGADAADVAVAEPLTVGPVTLIGASLIFGALMGFVFGWLIGRNKAEDDAFVTQQSLQEGELLLAVYVREEQVPLVERTLHVHHGRELAF